jgi:hypothetical protein
MFSLSFDARLLGSRDGQLLASAKGSDLPASARDTSLLRPKSRGLWLAAIALVLGRDATQHRRLFRQGAGQDNRHSACRRPLGASGAEGPPAQARSGVARAPERHKILWTHHVAARVGTRRMPCFAPKLSVRRHGKRQENLAGHAGIRGTPASWA